MVKIPYRLMKYRTIELPTWALDKDMLLALIKKFEAHPIYGNVGGCDQDDLALADLKTELMQLEGTIENL